MRNNTPATILDDVKRALKNNNLKPLGHRRGAITSLSTRLAQFVVPWEAWARPEGGGKYLPELEEAYGCLGILSGNGGLVTAAYRHDDSNATDAIESWEDFVEEILQSIDADDFFLYDDEPEEEEEEEEGEGNADLETLLSNAINHFVFQKR